MQSDQSVAPVSTAALWVGRIISGLVALFLVSAGVMDVARLPTAAQGMVKYGYPESSMVPIGIALLFGVALYVVPRLSVLGAIVLTGYLGGAVSTHVRAGDPVGLMVVPLLFGLLTWGGLYLRDGRLRELLPLRRPR